MPTAEHSVSRLLGGDAEAAVIAEGVGVHLGLLILMYISAALRLAKKSKLFEGAKRGSESTLDSNLRAYLRLILRFMELAKGNMEVCS